MGELYCKLYQNDFIVIPSTSNGNPCTGIFDLKKLQWKRLKIDSRTAPINGTLDRIVLKNGEEKLLHVGGK